MIKLSWAILGFIFGGMFTFYTKTFSEKTAQKILSQGLIIAAFIYIIFAIIWGDMIWTGIEILGVLIYLPFIILGSRRHFAWVGVGWLLHTVWDVGLHLLGAGKNIAPEWYAISCITFDF